MDSGIPLTGDWRHRAGSRRAHLYFRQASRENELDYWNRRPRCRIKLRRASSEPSSGLLAGDREVCPRCLEYWQDAIARGSPT